MNNLTTPDKRFAVRLFSDGDITAFIAVPAQSAHTASWERVPGTRILLVGQVHEQLRLLMDNYVTDDLERLLSVSASALHKLRLHLGMPTGPTGQHGGARPKAGRAIQAEHVLGLSALELARGDTAAARRRYDDVLAAGVLRPRGARPRGLDDPGSIRELDELAGDGQFIFLSRGKRYRAVRAPELCYGFVFDAEALIRAGALVAPDLLSDYEALADEIARDLDARAPGQPATDEEMADFAALFGGDDPALLAAVQAMSASRYWDILHALEVGDESTPEAAEALSRFRAGAAEIQARHRLSGDAALARLRRSRGHNKLEILVPGDLPLSLAIGLIERGEVILKPISERE